MLISLDGVLLYHVALNTCLVVLLVKCIKMSALQLPSLATSMLSMSMHFTLTLPNLYAANTRLTYLTIPNVPAYIAGMFSKTGARRIVLSIVLMNVTNGIINNSSRYDMYFSLS